MVNEKIPNEIYPEGFYRLPVVRKFTTLSTATIYRAMKAGTFPRPVRLTAGAVAWRGSVLLDWAASREM